MRLLPTFHDVFDDFFPDSFWNYSSTDIMRTDILEHDDTYIMNMELPGYQKEDISMELKDGYLLVSANKQKTNEKTDHVGNMIRKERYLGSCSRRFYVGDINENDIKATFENGELKITIPKKSVKQVESKKIISIE